MPAARPGQRAEHVLPAGKHRPAWPQPARLVIIAGAVWGRMALVRAGLASYCQLLSALVRLCTAVTGTSWLCMVRRRSTVRFRKGAPSSAMLFRNYSRSELSFSWTGESWSVARRRGAAGSDPDVRQAASVFQRRRQVQCPCPAGSALQVKPRAACFRNCSSISASGSGRALIVMIGPVFPATGS
jgi:hypothetical protein